MIWTIVPFGLVVIFLAAILLAASSALADKLVCISNEKLRGEETISNCVLRGEKFAIVDEQGAVRILSREEFELMKKLNPKLMEMKAYGIIYLKEAPEMKKLPPLATPKLYQ
jgi:hypothetical protein